MVIMAIIMAIIVITMAITAMAILTTAVNACSSIPEGGSIDNKYKTKHQEQ